MKKNEIVLFETSDKKIKLTVPIEQETVWLTQAQMVELFRRDVSVISRHIHHIFKEAELDKETNLHFLQIANSDKPVAYYSLDVIISVGYRVKSKRGIEFRKWANSELIDDHALVALTIIISESKPDEMEIMITVIMNCLK